jgi:hypothetical protein
MDNNVSVKKIDSKNLDNTPATYEMQIKEANLNLIPPLSINEYELLKESIRENGLLVPIIVNQEGIVLDGVHRHRACKELGLPIKTITKQIQDLSEERLFQIEVNLRRRQLNAYQRIEVGYSLEGILGENAKIRMSLGGVIIGLGNRKQSNSDGPERVASAEATLQSNEEKGKVSKIIGKKIGVSTSMYEKGKKIIKEANEFQKNSLRDGSTSLNRVYNQIRKQEIAQARAKNQAETDVKVKYPRTDRQERAKLIKGDFQEKQNSISDDSVDLIFTDPINYTVDLQIYRTLAIFASRVLKPGGNLVTYVPNHSLPQVFKNMSVPNLKFWWQLAITEENKISGVQGRNYVYSSWKPLLWYVKIEGPKSLKPITDLIEFAYVLAGLEYVISSLSREDDVVVDPFMGTGTIGKAALNVNRRFIGIERDRQLLLSAQSELSKARPLRRVE